LSTGTEKSLQKINVKRNCAKLWPNWSSKIVM
jgi:hypothetical protein